MAHCRLWPGTQPEEACVSCAEHPWGSCLGLTPSPAEPTLPHGMNLVLKLSLTAEQVIFMICTQKLGEICVVGILSLFVP